MIDDACYEKVNYPSWPYLAIICITYVHQMQQKTKMRHKLVNIKSTSNQLLPNCAQTSLDLTKIFLWKPNEKIKQHRKVVKMKHLTWRANERKAITKVKLLKFDATIFVMGKVKNCAYVCNYKKKSLKGEL